MQDFLFYWLLCAVVATVLYGVMIYNHLVRLGHRVDRAWSNIDVLLKQRHEEVPALVAVCREYMRFEREVLQGVTQARQQVFEAYAAVDVAALGGAESVLRASLTRLYVAVESYPELKASRSFLQLQQRICQLENQIADRREFFNESVTVCNIRIEQFPDVLVARWFGFRRRCLLEFAVEVREVPQVGGSL